MKTHIKKSIITTIVLFLSITMFSQDNIQGKIEATDYSLPSSPAFSLLDVNPEKINKPGFSRDFKLDWFLNGKNLKPDIAIEAQPVWILFFGETDYNDFQDIKWLGRTLSTMNFSIGTVQKDSVNSLAYSIKLTLFRDKNSDPMLSDELVKSFKEDSKEITSYILQKEGLIEKLEDIVERNDDNDKVEINNIRKKIKEIELIIMAKDITEKEYIKKKQKEFEDEHWNASMLDVGYGQILDYSNSNIDSLNFENKKHAVWVNGSYGKEKILLSAMYRQYFYSDNNDFLAGINLRYGSSKLNFFIETAYEKIAENDKITIGYGGDYKLNSNYQIQFGLRTEYTKDFNLKSLMPVININWLMNKD